MTKAELREKIRALAFTVVGEKSKADDEDFDINENPEFLRLQGQHEANLKEIALKEKFIEELKNDKQALRDSVKSVDEFENYGINNC